MSTFGNPAGLGPCVNCGRPPAEHQPWPQCPDGGTGWRKRIGDAYLDRLEVRKRHSGAWWLVAILVALALLLAGMSFYNPNLNVPVISPVVCSLKGDTWYSGGILGAPGCYRPGMG